MKIRVVQVTSTSQGLVLGLQVRGPRDSWVKFGLVEVPWREVPNHVIDDFWKWHDRDEIVSDIETPLPLDWH